MNSNKSATKKVASLLAASLLGLSLGVSAQTPPPSALVAPAGEVEFARGVGFAQSAGQNPRTLGKGLSLKEGDRLTTSDGSSAIIKLADGTRMTVRPNSDLVIQQYRFAENAPDNSMVMQLLAGGFRAITGLISKSAPGAARVNTKTATIGIRGTDFDARLCTTDCKTESAKVPEKPRPNAVQASAKLVTAQGDISATDAEGARRRVVAGASLYPGETLETGPGAQTVLAFRDDSRMTLGAATRFRIDNFAFDPQNPSDGRFLVSLLRGSMRALTGLIGKANNRNVSFSTATATVGIRGTGLDLDCGSDAACSFFTWLGTIEVAQKDANGQTGQPQTALQVLQAGQGLFVSATEMRPLTSSTLEQAPPGTPPTPGGLPRPDTVPADIGQLFTASALDDGQEGLFVFVRDGHIEVSTNSSTLHLGKGETGFAADTGATVRPLLTPLFLEFDKMPLPNSKNPMLVSVLSETGVRSANQCR